MFTPLKASDNYNDNPLSFPFLGRNGFPTSCWPSPSGRPPAAVATQLWRWSFGGILEGSVFSAPPEGCGVTGVINTIFVHMAGSHLETLPAINVSGGVGVCYQEI